MEEAPTHTVIVIFCKQPWVQFCHPVYGNWCCPPVFLTPFRKKKLQGSDGVEAEGESHLFKIFQSLIGFPAGSIGFLLLCVAAQLLPPRKARQGKSGSSLLLLLHRP